MYRPKPGEYWYVKFNNQHHIFKVQIKDGISYYGLLWPSISGGKKYRFNESDFLEKWEPNFFWKLLGYK